jgi:hypothetical protein
MRHSYKYFLLSCLLIAAGCNQNKRTEEKNTEATEKTAGQKENFEAGNLYRAVTGSTNTAQSYALYLPHRPATAAMLFSIRMAMVDFLFQNI